MIKCLMQPHGLISYVSFGVSFFWVAANVHGVVHAKR